MKIKNFGKSNKKTIEAFEEAEDFVKGYHNNNQIQLKKKLRRDRMNIKGTLKSATF